MRAAPLVERDRLSGRSLVSGSAVQMGGRAAAIVLQAASVALLTRLLGQARFGDFSAGLATVGIVAAVAEFGLTAMAVVRMGRGEAARSVVRSCALASLVTGLVGLAIAVPTSFALFDASKRLALWVLLPGTAVELGGIGLVAYWQHRLAFARNALASAAGQAVGCALVAVVLLDGRRLGESAQFLAVGGAMLAASATVVALLVPRGPDRLAGAPRSPAARDVRSLLLAALPLGLAGSLSLMHMRADQVILAALGYRRSLASYAIAYQVLQGVVVAVGSVGAVGFSFMAASSSGDRARHARRSAALLCDLGVVASAGVALLAPVAVYLLGGSSYDGALHVSRLLAPVVVLSVGNTMAGRVLIVEGRARSLVYVASGALLVNVALCLLLIPRYGIGGAAVATVSSEALGAALVVAIAERAVPTSQPVAILVVAAVGSTAAALTSASSSGGVPVSLGLWAATLVGCLLLSREAWSRRDPLRAGAPCALEEPDAR